MTNIMGNRWWYILASPGMYPGRARNLNSREHGKLDTPEIVFPVEIVRSRHSNINYAQLLSRETGIQKLSPADAMLCFCRAYVKTGKTGSISPGH